MPQNRNLTPESVYKQRQAGLLLRRHQRYTIIDAFCGAGGMSLGFSAKFGHPFETVWANDSDAACRATYEANFGTRCIQEDIIHVLQKRGYNVPHADVVIGGPPCQAHSLLGKRDDGDPRRQLWRPFLDIVNRSQAAVFVMENVPELINSFEGGEVVECARTMGFRVWSVKLCAADYGVPQTRWRAFIVGWRHGDPRRFFPPIATHKNPNGERERSRFKTAYAHVPNPSRWQTVRDAIGDLPEPRGTDITRIPPPMNLHFGRQPTQKSVRRYRAIPEEGMDRFDLERNAPELVPRCWREKRSGGTDVFGRLWWDRPAFTIRTEFFKPEKGRYLHPKQDRAITHREAARLQSFPDDFLFMGNKTQVARQIGNAVPPLLASRVADCVYAMLRSTAESA